MKKEYLTLTVKLKAKAGMSERLHEAARALLGPTRSESGCIDYYFHVSNNDPHSCLFYENWIDQASLDRHLSMPYLKDFQKILDEILAEKPEFTFWKIQE